MAGYLGLEQTIVSNSAVDQYNDVATLSTGVEVVLWQETDASGHSLLKFRFLSSGAPTGPAISIADSAYAQPSALTQFGRGCLAALDDGNFVVAWDTPNGVSAQIFDANGSSISEVIPVASGHLSAIT